jgi:dTDP-glucose 4,6-dehydratase
MRLLVTGGMGFIGSNFIHYMLATYGKKIKIVNLDKLTYAGNPANLKDIAKDPRYKFIKGDICDPKIVDKAMKGCDVVVNFAAETHVDRSIMDAGSFIHTDIYGAFVLLEASRRYKIQRFLQISTDEVYGHILKGSLKETSPLNPRNPYSASKAGADRMCHSYYQTHDVPVVISRSSNNFGPNQYPEKLIPLFVTNLMEGKKVPVYGKGNQVRDWIYVGDNCEGLDVVLKKGKLGEAYNIGGGNELQNIQITKMILEQMGKDETSIEHVKDRPGHDLRYSLDCKKLKALGWKPRSKFKTALKETVQWYIDNPSWWKPLKSGEFMKYYKKVIARKK